MSKPNFTPGPLRTKRGGEPGYPFGVLGAPHPVDGGDYAPIAVFTKEADAKLFAAAPALYEAARAILIYDRESDDDRSEADHFLSEGDIEALLAVAVTAARDAVALVEATQ